MGGTFQEPRADIGCRIAVIGSTGSGKTTLARAAALRLGIPHVELDSLHWDPGWRAAPEDAFRERVSDAISGDTWVVDGNYRQVRDIVWPRADTLVWLDLPLPVIYRRLVRRTAARIITRKPLWNSNRERVRDLFAKDNLFWWAYLYHRHRRPEIPEQLALPEHRHLALHHLRTPREVTRWLEVTRRGDTVPPYS